MNNIEGYNLSNQQKLIWDIYSKSNEVVWSSCCIKIVESLDHAKLKNSLIELTQRHEILSTKFHSVDGLSYPLQVLADFPLLEFSVFEVETDALRCYIDKAIDGSDLKLYIDLYEAKTGGQLLKIKVPALMMDTYTLLLFVKQWLKWHELGSEALDVVQYIDYSEWQSEVVGTNGAAIDFWHSRKNMTMPMLPSELLNKDSIEWSKTRSYSVQSQSAPVSFSRALSLWTAVLQHFTKSNEISVMVLFEGKVAPEFIMALGHYANKIPFAINTDEIRDLSHLEEQTKEILSELTIFQMDKPQSELSHSANCVGFEFYELSSSYDENYSVIEVSSSKLLEKLTLVCCAGQDQSTFRFDYPVGMYQDEFIANLAESFLVLLDSGDYSQSLSKLDLFSTQQHVKLVEQFNQTRQEYPNISFHEAFEAQVTKTPEALAVKDYVQSVSYQVLNQRANQIARYLINTHNVKGRRVGVCMTRNVELLSVLLGILKAGATYIALTPDTPASRMAHIAEHAAIVLTEQTWIPLLQDALPGKICLAYEDCQRQAIQFDKDNLLLESNPDDIAYVLFTSGSTGVPKGVEVTQRGLTNYLTYSAETYFRNADCAIVHTSIAFDLTVTCLFAPLICGKYLLMVDDQDGVEGLKRALLSENTPHLVKMTPSHLKALSPWVASLPKDQLKIASLVVGGESLYHEDLRSFLDNISDVKIYNEYGPTEATVGCCVYPVQNMSTGIVPIGKPIANTTLYVLNEDKKPVPPWSVGELYIGGDGLAQGYLNLEEVTKDRFCDNPFSTKEGSKLYKTGDLVKYTYDNGYQLEFLGRNDRQIKVRSYRIELDEIESVLLTHETIKQAVVVAKPNRFNENEIIAYIVSDEKLLSKRVAEYVSNLLPDYMVPSHYHFVDAIPLTSNGKTDIKVLNTLYLTQWTSAQEFVEPRTELEITIAQYWKQALKLEKIGIYDNFFELGGDSIRSVHIVGLLKDEGYDLSAQDLFINPTIEQLAQKCEAVKHKQQEQEQDELRDMLLELENMSEEEVAQHLKKLEGA